MRRFTFFLIVLYVLTLPAGIQPAAVQDGPSAKTIKILIPTANATWVVGKTVAVRWIRGKYPWMKVNIDLICQAGGGGWGAPRIPVRIAKNIPDSGHWSGILKKPMLHTSHYYIRITRGTAGGISGSINIVNKK